MKRIQHFLLISVFVCGMISGNFLNFDDYIDEDDTEADKQLTKLAEKYKPILIFDKNEKFWPAAIEWFKIDWTKATLNDSTAHVSYDYKGPEQLDKSAPIYVSIFENDDKSIRISYAFLYAFNGCGPYMRIKINSVFGFDLNKDISICPLGLHNGDIERITLNISSDRKTIKSVIYAYHDSNKEFKPEEIKFNGNRPIVFVANGSHASYPTVGEQKFLDAFKYKRNTFTTEGFIADNINIDEKVIEWGDYSIRVLKINGLANVNISKEESYLAFLFTGKLGAPMTNKNFDFFTKEASAYAETLKILSPQAYQYAMGAIMMLGKEVKKEACPTLAGSGRENWW